MSESTAYARRGFKGGAKASTIPAGIAQGASTFAGADLSTWAGATANGPARLKFNAGFADEEIAEFTTLVGNNVSGLQRGVDGTTDQQHAANCTVTLVSTARDFDEANAVAHLLLGVGSAVAGDMYVVSAASGGVPTALARVPKGTAYQKLRMNAGATAPEWAGLVGCSAKKAATETCASGATLAGVVFGAEDYDTSSFHSTSANTDSFVAPYTGYHRVNYGIGFTNGATVSSGPVQTYLKYNNQSTNVAIDLGADKLETTELKASVAQILAGTGTKFLNAGDVLTLVFDNASGSTATLSTGTACYFQIEFLGPA